MAIHPSEPTRLASRRRFLKRLIWLGTGAFTVAFALPALAIKTLTQEHQDVAQGDPLVYAAGGSAGEAINANDIQQGGAVHAFPQGKSDDENNIIELVRIGEGTEGLVAFSAICTHLGCTVLAKLTDQGYIPCPCHASLFDPKQDAKPVGGPANRALPSLPISVDDQGAIVATGDFSGPVGPL
jgi:rieske iron-sulfur protein